MKLRFIREDAKTVTVENGLGWKIRVAKSGLRPAQLREIQSFAGGGEVASANDLLLAQLAAASGHDPALFATGDDTLGQRLSGLGSSLAGMAGPMAKLAATAAAPLVGGPFGTVAGPMLAPGAFTDANRAAQVTARASGHLMSPSNVPAARQQYEYERPPGAPGVQPTAERGAPPTEGVPPLLARPADTAATQAAPRGAGGGLGAYRRGMDKAVGAEQAAMARQGDLAQQEATAEADAMKAQMAQAAEIDVSQQRMELAHSKSLEVQQERIGKAMDDYSGTKIDPSRFWASRSTGDKVLAGIGLLLGSFGQGGNKSVDVITQAIDRDLEAQRSNLATKGRSAENQRGLLADMRSRFGDESTALNVARAASIGRVQMQLKEMATRASGPEKAAALEQASAALEQQRVGALQKVTQETEALASADRARQGQLEMEKARVQAALRVAGGQGDPREGAKRALIEGQDLFSKVGKEIYVGSKAFGDSDASRYASWRQANAMALATALHGGKPPGSFEEALAILDGVGLPSAWTGKAGGSDAFAKLNTAIERTAQARPRGSSVSGVED